MNDFDKQRIEPESFTPANAPVSTEIKKPSSQTSTEKNATSLVSLYAVAGLILIALIVVFLPTGQNADSNEELPQLVESEAVNQIGAPAETPWADSQLLKARRETQEILAELLGIQNRLEAAQIEVWGAESYLEIQALAEQGDAEYQERNFEQSLQNYQEALDKALKLDASVPEVASSYFSNGVTYLNDGEINDAIDALNLANQLMPGNPETQNVLRQAEVRGSTLASIDQSEFLSSGANEFDLDKLQEARQLLEQAKTLDSEFSPLNESIEVIEEKILEANFRAYMSEGFSALSSNQFDKASDAFNKAKTLKPGDTGVDAALRQVEAEKLNNERQIALSNAENLEASENWQDALSLYNQLLQEDSSLSAARLGKIRAEARFKLDQDIEGIITDPLALQSESKWQAANGILSNAVGISDKGSKLQSQIDTLKDIVKNARTPVVLKLTSDNLTEIEIYRVGKLGSFVEQAMNLNPGKYVIVGRRTGYQDVRVDLTIDGTESEINLVIRCEVAV